MTDKLTVARVVEEDGQLFLAVLPDFFDTLELKDGQVLVFKKTSDDAFEVTKVNQ